MIYNISRNINSFFCYHKFPHCKDVLFYIIMATMIKRRDKVILPKFGKYLEHLRKSKNMKQSQVIYKSNKIKNGLFTLKTILRGLSTQKEFLA